MALECHTPRCIQGWTCNQKVPGTRLGRTMAPPIRNNDWEEDKELKADLETYVKQNLKIAEILEFFSKVKYPMFARNFHIVHNCSVLE